MKKLFILFTILMIITVSGCINEEPVGCPEDAKICPDGTIVVRVGPDCEFEECPEIQDETENKTIEEPETIETNTIYVDVLRSEFSPSQITVEPGTTIIWTNKDDRPHAVGGAQLGGSSGKLMPGESWSYTISKTQTYRFYDTFYYFKGTIIVE